MENIDYVIYDADGVLQGGYCQPLHPDHAANHILVTPEQREAWTSLAANAARDGVELAPVIEPEPPAPVVPQKVTRRQGLQALLLIGVTVPMIEAHIEASGMTELQKGLALIEVRDSQHFERNRPLVVSIGSALELDLDELFTTAASL